MFLALDKDHGSCNGNRHGSPGVSECCVQKVQNCRKKKPVYKSLDNVLEESTK